MTRLLTGLLLVACTVALTLTGAHPATSNPPAPAVQAVVPYNAAVYNGPPGLTPEQGKKLLALLESIDGKLDALAEIEERLGQPGGPAAKSAAAPKLTWQQVVPAKCASCHNPKNAKGDFILVGDDKAPKPLNAREWLKVQEAVNSEHMPPPPAKLTAEQKASFKKK